MRKYAAMSLARADYGSAWSISQLLSAILATLCLQDHAKELLYECFSTACSIIPILFLLLYYNDTRWLTFCLVGFSLIILI